MTDRWRRLEHADNREIEIFDHERLSDHPLYAFLAQRPGDQAPDYAVPRTPSSGETKRPSANLRSKNASMDRRR